LKFKTTIFLILLLSIKSYSQTSTDKLTSKDEFNKYSGLPLSDKYGQVSALKIAYDLESNKIYYISSKYYKYHYDFCYSQLYYEVNLEYFNKANYSNDSSRSFLLANINYFKSLNIYALEICPVDLMSTAQILKLYNVVSKTTFIGDSLKLLLNSARLQNEKQTFEKIIPILSPEEVYSNLNYQAISKHSSYGVLKFIDNLELQKNELTPTDIIVLKETPVYLPIVAGIIVNEFQTPLSHLTILGQNRKIPISAYKSAFQDTLLRSFENKKVLYTVLGDTFKIEQVDELKKSNAQLKDIKLEYNLTVDSLVNIEFLDKKSFTYAGNKAANLGILYKLSKKAEFKTPESAFVIPFYFYKEHIKYSNAQKMIDTLLSKKTIYLNKDSLKIYLKAIRDEIKNSPVDTVLLSLVNNKIKTLGNYSSFRFRSSTNAEDAKGFSGAGLYTSKTGTLNDKNKPIDKAIKEVWASLWSYEAFLEREYYNINHRDVYMAILVHRSFPDEGVNGVAITKNLYRSDDYGFVINAQLGDESVVKPDSGIVSDQFICYPGKSDNIYINKNTVDIITTSNLNYGTLVMTEQEIQNLADQLEIIKKYFIHHTITSKSYLDFGLDLEFKLDGKNRDLYFKQVRFYND